MPPDELPNGGSSDVFWDDEYGFSTMGVGAILGNGCGIQRQITLHWFRGVRRQQGLTTGVEFYVYNVIG